ncbi:MAG: sulfatase [Actinobacteria bacterium]|nr:sulfatase [Actinomycetota bacterium]
MMAARKLLSAALVALLMSSACTEGDRSERPPHPNVLVIVTDDQRADGTMDVMPKTLHWFAEGGVTFERGYVTTPVCCPSRASILTGQYVHNHGVRTNDDALKLQPGHLLQTYLQGAGYRTSIVGKYLVHPGPYDDPQNVGIDPPHFDDWRTFLGGYRQTLFNVNGDLQTVDEYPTRYIADSAVELLGDYEQEDAEPWLLYVAPFAPHYPWVPASRYRDAELPSWDAPPSVEDPSSKLKPPWVAAARIPPQRSVKARNHQLRTLMSVDDLVDRVLAKAEELDETQDTLIFFLSDNGYHWGEHGLGEKSSPYVESVRVPFYVRWPDRLSPGTTDDRIVANIDVMPTILDAAGIEPSRPVDGRSLLRDGGRRELLIEHWKEAELNLKVPSWSGLITRAGEYIRTPTGRGAFEEYYDLGDDPYERRNLAALRGYGIFLAGLKKRLDRASSCRGEACP